jgi:hypothetical protein
MKTTDRISILINAYINPRIVFLQNQISFLSDLEKQGIKLDTLAEFRGQLGELITIRQLLTKC